jgi:Protein of unknown function (DUF2752)
MRRGDRCAADRRSAIRFVWEAASGSTPRGRLGAAFFLAAVLAALGPDRLARGPRLCLISAIIRRPCPACGLTRAAAALLRGDVRRAIRTNPRIIPVAVIGLSVLLSDIRSVIMNRQDAKDAKREERSVRCDSSPRFLASLASWRF